MKLTIKTLQQKVFQIDAEATETVGDVKQKIAESQGHTVESQKIIYAGKVLQDSKTVESCQIKEKDFLVLMVSKPKAAPAASSSTAASSTPAAPAAPAASTPEAPAVAPSEPAPTAPPATAPVETGPVDMSSSFLSGGALEQAVNNLIEMGFERTQVLRAMRASFNNPNRAAEYLMTGIPEGLEPEQPAAAPAAQPAAQAAAPAAGDAAAAPAAAQPAPVNLTGQNLFQLAQQQQQQQAAQNPLGGAGRGGLGGGNLQQLMNSPQAAQLRQLVQTNPAMLQTLIQSLAASDPALAQTLAQNPEMLMQMLAGENMGGEGDDGEGNPIPPGATVIELTPAEREAVQRLEALGFSRQAVLEAYIVCDKNEEFTANFLFEHGGDDE